MLFSLNGNPPLFMDVPRKPRTIENLIKGTIQRAVRETAAGVLVIFFSTYLLQRSVPGEARYYGCLLVLVSTSFVLGVIWSYTLSYRLLRTHPASDTAFWREAFAAQARLLRLVPLWYLAPMGSGILLVFASTPGRFTSVAVRLLFLGVLFGAVTWLNRAAASRLEESAATLSA
jgi:hypothetical protein